MGEERERRESGRISGEEDEGGRGRGTDRFISTAECCPSPVWSGVDL